MFEKYDLTRVVSCILGIVNYVTKSWFTSCTTIVEQ